MIDQWFSGIWGEEEDLVGKIQGIFYFDKTISYLIL